jgi:hypothetical protein
MNIFMNALIALGILIAASGCKPNASSEHERLRGQVFSLFMGFTSEKLMSDDALAEVVDRNAYVKKSMKEKKIRIWYVPGLTEYHVLRLYTINGRNFVYAPLCRKNSFVDISEEEVKGIIKGMSEFIPN